MGQTYFCGVDVSKKKAFLSILDENSNIYSLKTLETSSQNDVQRGSEIFDKMHSYISENCDMVSDGNRLIVSIESPIYLKNIRTSFDIARMVYCIELACSFNGVESFDIPPPTWKKLVLGNGKANKDDIKKFAQTKWPRIHFNVQDEYDASCIALYGYLLLNVKTLSPTT